MTCATCGCVILLGEACVGGDGAYRHADPQTCIKALAIARDWSRSEARRLAAMVCAMSPVVRAARIARVRKWQYGRATVRWARVRDAVPPFDPSNSQFRTLRRFDNARRRAFSDLEEARAFYEKAVADFAKGRRE